MLFLAAAKSMKRRTRLLWATALAPSAAGFHELLPCPKEWKPPSDDFRAALQEAGVTQVCFLRHGQTAKSETGNDFDRYLTDTGRQQARIAGASFGKDLLVPFFQKVLVSPAPRTVETAEIFLQAAAASNASAPSLTLVNDLYDNTMQPEGSKLFAKRGYAPLQDYLEAEDDYDRAVTRDLLGTYAASSMDAVHALVQEEQESRNSMAVSSSFATLLIVAHAIYLPAAALGMASMLGCMAEDSLRIPLLCNTREAEGYLLDLATTPQVRYLSRPVEA
jgi:broad specificity phosphatase PhoE